MALGVLLPLHCHIGFGALVTDYLPARKFPRIYILAKSLLYIGTAGTAYGLYQYNTTDIGICEGMRTLWKAKEDKALKE
jgi:succinate dehydrogenase (ubiquinone) membrane anchor subunit